MIKAKKFVRSTPIFVLIFIWLSTGLLMLNVFRPAPILRSPNNSTALHSSYSINPADPDYLYNDVPVSEVFPQSRTYFYETYPLSPMKYHLISVHSYTGYNLEIEFGSKTSDRWHLIRPNSSSRVYPRVKALITNCPAAVEAESAKVFSLGTKIELKTFNIYEWAELFEVNLTAGRKYTALLSDTRGKSFSLYAIRLVPNGTCSDNYWWMGAEFYYSETDPVNGNEWVTFTAEVDDTYAVIVMKPSYDSVSVSPTLKIYAGIYLEETIWIIIVIFGVVVFVIIIRAIYKHSEKNKFTSKDDGWVGLGKK
jgi:hypothetical protein